MYVTFYNCREFNQDIGGWNTGKVTNFYGTFANAWEFNQNIGVGYRLSYGHF